MINKVILVGNVGADPEVNIVGETKVASFSIATTESWKDKDGSKKDSTEWHNVEVWRGLADVVEMYVHKGSQLYIEGKLKTDSYEKDGVTKYRTKVVCKVLKMVGGKRSESIPPPQAPPENPNDTYTGNGDDLPF